MLLPCHVTYTLWGIGKTFDDVQDSKTNNDQNQNKRVYRNFFKCIFTTKNRNIRDISALL